MIVLNLQTQTPGAKGLLHCLGHSGQQVGEGQLVGWGGGEETGAQERRRGVGSSRTSRGTRMKPSGALDEPLKPLFLLSDVLGPKGQNPALLAMQTAM